MRLPILLFALAVLILPVSLSAQQEPVVQQKVQPPVPQKALTPRDFTDVLHSIFHKRSPSQDTVLRKKGQFQLGVLPAIGYTLQTGFALVVSANALHFSKQNDSLYPSTYIGSISYSQNKQIIAPLQSVIYFNHNKSLLISDLRFLKYPSYTYGLGIHSRPAGQQLLDFEYFKFHESFLLNVGSGIYVGAGYYLDYFWRTHADPAPPEQHDVQHYGFPARSFSSGLSFNALRDTRDNPVNAYSGSFFHLSFNPRLQLLGSDKSWGTMVVDYRAYKRFPESSSNILAFWSYNWFSLYGKPPYLMLPSTGWDKSYNTGRGYIQGRFRSNNMIDAETEYRIRLSQNGLFGMVVFGNLQSFSEINTWRFEGIAPGGGLGLRIKLNKFSRTNISIDYGIGRQGSRGFFVNLGEVF